MKYFNICNIFDQKFSEDVELRRIFPNEFPQDVIRRSGSLDPEVSGMRYYFLFKFDKLLVEDEIGFVVLRVQGML